MHQHLLNSCADNIRILYYNNRSIVCKLGKLKATCLLYKPDIVCIVETLLGSEIHDSEVCIPNYELTHLDRAMVEALPSMLLVTFLSVSSLVAHTPLNSLFWKLCCIPFVQTSLIPCNII